MEKKQIYSDFVTEQLANKEFVHSASNNILDNPVYIITDGKEKQGLYSKDQMIEMFKAGAMSITKNILEENLSEENVSRTLHPFRVMKQMTVGSIKYFPYAKWTAARTAASSLKRQFGCVFVVTKDADHNEIGKIKVKRIK